MAAWIAMQQTPQGVCPDMLCKHVPSQVGVQQVEGSGNRHQIGPHDVILCTGCGHHAQRTGGGAQCNADKRWAKRAQASVFNKLGGGGAGKEGRPHGPARGEEQ